MPDNTKGADDTKRKYSYANSVDVSTDSVDKITLRDESYSVENVHFGDKDIDN